jgi:poly(3-hydroxybutyrate) depolymerase
VRHLVREGVTDAARVGIYGWSYGGYMTAMCLCKAPNTFKVGSRTMASAPACHILWRCAFEIFHRMRHWHVHIIYT